MRPRLIPIAVLILGLGIAALFHGSTPPVAVGEPALTGPVWQWQGTNLADDRKLEPSDPSRYTVQFGEDGRLVARVDCNRTLGSYTMGDGSLSIKLGPTTLIACPPGTLAPQFATQLQQVSRYRLSDTELVLELSGDGGSMRFTPMNGS